MAVILNLIGKASGEIYSGRDFVKVDEDMCRILGVDSDPIDFYKNWIDTVGFSLACGETWAEVRERWTGYPDDKLDVVDYLETYFDNASYHGR